MTNQWKQAWLVASWEFARYFKWKDQFLGLLFFAVLSVLGYGTAKLATGGRSAMRVATVGVELSPSSAGRLRVVPAPADSAARADGLTAGDYNGVLSRRADGSFELFVQKDPRYLPELQALVTDLVRRERLAAAGLLEAELERILAPPSLAVRFADPDRPRTGRAERVVAAAFLGVVLLATFTSMAYLLTGITGEKQLRVTESITAIIPPQAWVDGKIIGIGGYALVTIANMLVGGTLLALAAKVAWGFKFPDIVGRPGVILLLGLYSLLALALWNAMFAAFASTIDDPNTSSRTSVMFLPMLPLAMTIAVLKNPDDVSSRILAVFPLTSPSAMPVRVILSDPGPLEIAASIAILVATIWLVRRLAGRIFEVGMLMYGKEPTMREIWRWASSRREQAPSA